MRDLILREIKRLAGANGGKAPGVGTFTKETGIGQQQWRGVHWARWGDALREAGFEANTLTPKLDSDGILLKLAELTRAQGSLPTKPEVMMCRRRDQTFPAPNTIAAHFGSRADLITALRAFCEVHNDHSDVLTLLPASGDEVSEGQPASKTQDGYVYLFRLGTSDRYKIGRTGNIEQRFRAISTAAPDTLDMVHRILTDDPSGIEAYWHKRFGRQRLDPRKEWFVLSRADVTVFRRRKFQ